MVAESLDLFQPQVGISGPLASRLRPLKLEDFSGHESILGEGKPLRKWIEADRVPSLIFWGPPGCGKTTLAKIIAEKTLSHFIHLSAVLAGVKEIKETIERARMTLALSNRKTILFIDEIHRFNKTQQDALLPHVEEGIVTLIGATTENPSFELNRALLSRTRVIRLERLDSQALEKIVARALWDRVSGLGGLLKLSKEAIAWIASHSDGDARRALTTLETLSLQGAGISGEAELSQDQVQKILSDAALARQPIAYDKKGEEHYNVISAFIKSMRASDHVASVYYLARMLEGGEDPLFIARRMVVFASEDIGNADPRALLMALAAKEAVEFVGLPECRINLAHAVTYLAKTKKDRSAYDAIESALEEVRETGGLPVPVHLRNRPDM